MKYILFFTILLSNAAFSNPFGLEMGMKLEQIEGKTTKIKTGFYQLTSVPKPHSAFETYHVQIAPKSGLCFISAKSRGVKTKPDGIRLKSAFYNMQNKYEKKYGKSEVEDALNPGSTWSKQNDWMIGLFDLQRDLYARWNKDTGAKLKNNINEIWIVAVTTGKTDGFLYVSYSFSNRDECINEIVEKMHKDEPLEVNPDEDKVL